MSHVKVNYNIPILATMGPTARAKAPSDLKIPITVPFWSCDPSFETRVIIHGTTIAVAAASLFILRHSLSE